MIDVEREELIPLADACRWIGERTGKAPPASTARAWIAGCLKGGHRLESARVGGRIYTSVEALTRFLTRHDRPDPVPVAITKRRMREIEAAERELDRILGPL